MADWKEKIPGCFGVVDHKFAVHPADATRALELLNVMVKEKVPRREVREAFRAYLETKTKDQNYIQEQMSSVRIHFAPWLE